MAQRYAYIVGASMYGGPGDPSSGTHGYKGDDLRGRSAYAELLMGTALGNLPYRTQLRITYRGSPETVNQTVIAEKLDIGAGGAPVKGRVRRIDLWYQVADKLGFNFAGTDLVVIERVDGQPIYGLTPDSPESLKKYGAGTIGSTTVGAGILGTGIGPNTEKEGSEASEKFREGVEGAISWTSELGKILAFLGSSSGWLRVGKVALGGVLLIVAIDELTKIGPTGNTNLAPKGAGAVKAATKVAGKTPTGKLLRAGGNPLDAIADF